MPDDVVTGSDSGEAPDVNYVFVTGGVMSGLGKGITAASVGRLLKDRGLDVTAVKIDPYLNVDAGTMNPFQHGEVFVLDDGGEVDLDLGTYERFLNTDMSSANNITTGKVYQEVITRERDGDYLGETVQIIPHVTDEIKRRIRTVARGHDVCIIEVGGTVGDIEGMPFLETLRQFHVEEPEENIAYMHVTLVPYSPTGEQKTKPTQHSVKELRSIGVQPDVIVGRCTEPLEEKTRRKIAMFCDVPVDAVFSNADTENLYEVPLKLEQGGLDEYLLEKFDVKHDMNSNRSWKAFTETPQTDQIDVAIVGKYSIDDAYHSIYEALSHVGLRNGIDVTPHLVDAEALADNIPPEVTEADGIIVPGGFGERGLEGKIQAIQYARQNNIPFLGLCLGFQMAVVEFARKVCGLDNAHSTEIAEETPHPVIDILPEQQDVEQKGGTMRLGSYTTDLVEDSLVHQLYESKQIDERHRHRYEVNPDYIDILTEHGLAFTGTSGRRMEVLELPTDRHPFFIGVQFHPEYTSRPLDPNPLFERFVEASQSE